MTVPETLMAVGISGLVFAAAASFFLFSARSMHMLGNYDDLDRANRSALDTMSRDIRNAKALISFSTNELVFSNATTPSTFSYIYDAAAGTLTRNWGDTSTILLTNCDSLSFDISQRNPSNDFTFYSAKGVVANAKLVDLKWSCYRTITGEKINSQSMQTAKIVMRN